MSNVVIVDTIVDTVLNNEVALQNVIDLARSGVRARARLIRNAILPARGDIPHKCISNADFYAAYVRIADAAGIKVSAPPKGSAKAYEVVEYIYGVEVSDMTAEELLSAIKRAQTEVAGLQETGVESTYITSAIESLNTAIDKMVAALDNL